MAKDRFWKHLQRSSFVRFPAQEKLSKIVRSVSLLIKQLGQRNCVLSWENGERYLTLDIKVLTWKCRTSNCVGKWKKTKKQAQLSCSLLISEMGLSFILALKHSLLSRGGRTRTLFPPWRAGQLLQVEKPRPIFQEFGLFFFFLKLMVFLLCFQDALRSPAYWLLWSQPVSWHVQFELCRFHE